MTRKSDGLGTERVSWQWNMAEDFALATAPVVELDAQPDLTQHQSAEVIKESSQVPETTHGAGLLPDGGRHTK